MATTPGLRERKNARTREAITRATLELALEQGYERTSVAEIAERADVSPRTVFSWFPTKDAIVFNDPEAPLERLRAIFDEGGDTLELVKRWFEGEAAQGGHGDRPDELEQLRLRAIMADPYLRDRLHGLFGTLEELVAAAVAADVGLQPDDVGPRAFAAAVVATLLGLVEHAFVHGTDDKGDQLAQGMALLRGALDGLRGASRP